MRTIGNLDKETMAMASGASIGVIQTVVMKEYIDPTYGPFPGVSGILPSPWDRWSTFGNILIGGIMFGLTSFTSVISNKSYVANKFLQLYGITTLIGGIANGVFAGGLGLRRAGARAPALRATARPAAAQRFGAGQLTPTGIPMNKILA